MRKFFVFITILAFSVPLLRNTQADADGILLKDFSRNSAFYQSLNLRSEVLKEIVILPEQPFDEREALAIISRLDKLPPSMLAKINREGIRVKLFKGKLTDNPSARHLQGVIPRGYKEKTWDVVPGIGGGKTVLVKIGASAKGQGHGSVNLELHELAHSVDRHVYHEIRKNPVFLKIWKEEAGQLFPGQAYFLTFPEEYFAETFAMFFLGGETRAKFEAKAPKTYAFLNALF
jgi:hypothetical protein